ncbi:MAG TPA: elongation factor P maturation arginine rhamnosyltransferase EarP [Burkholderiaceae bacterium]|nr:elongation factor P maturation arginine rhamnosyltransferase EarP [Burkholderiaceae bacterium]
MPLSSTASLCPKSAILAPTWHIFCKVVDNFGDIGVCWRLACQLAVRGKTVRLWVDDTTALTWMAPDCHPNVTVMDCGHGLPEHVELQPDDILVDTFGCDFAINIIALQAINTPHTGHLDIIKPSKQPVWLNLEHLTAESFAQRNHTLPTIYREGAAAGWTQHYFYPGFNDKTGGLLRETDLTAQQNAFERVVWLAQMLSVSSLRFDPSTCYISLFCYEPHALAALIDQLANNKSPACLLVTAGRATAAVKAVLEHKKRLQPTYTLHKLLSIVYLDAMTQVEYDQLLWSCDLNFVRGEDSLVRAIWAGKPFVWHIYPQDDGVHHTKLEAFLQMMDAPESIIALHRAWNENPLSGIVPPLPILDLAEWGQSAMALRQKLLAQPDLCSQLIDYAGTMQEKQLKS